MARPSRTIGEHINPIGGQVPTLYTRDPVSLVVRIQHRQRNQMIEAVPVTVVTVLSKYGSATILGVTL